MWVVSAEVQCILLYMEQRQKAKHFSGFLVWHVNVNPSWTSFPRSS